MHFLTVKIPQCKCPGSLHPGRTVLMQDCEQQDHLLEANAVPRLRAEEVCQPMTPSLVSEFRQIQEILHIAHSRGKFWQPLQVQTQAHSNFDN